MKTSIILVCLWVVAATITALLPMRRQIYSGLPLLILAPILLIYLGYETNWWVVLIVLAAFASMLRHPLRYLVRRALGLPVTLPKELQKGEK